MNRGEKSPFIDFADSNFLLGRQFLGEGSVPCVVPYLSRVAVNAKHAISVACAEDFKGVVPVERCHVANCGSWIVSA